MITTKTTQESIVIKNDLLQKDSFQLTHLDVFGENNRSYISELRLFSAYFGYFPNLWSYNEIDCRKTRIWFEENYKNDIKESIFNKIHQNRKAPEIDDVFYFIDEDLIVNFDTNCSIVRFLFKKTDICKVEKIADNIRKFKKRKKTKSEIFLLINSRFGIDTEPMKITKQKLNITENYNDDFLPIHKIITERLNKDKNKGLILLHGKPGTGKTSYIRHLISSVKKKVIFLPPNMASNITSPALLSVLIDNPNSIFVIEDAENIISSREQNVNSPVSALLNLSDGLLSDCLNIQIICSFNTDLSRVDSALLRKGRLIAKYEFKELETQKAQKLSDKLGFQTQIVKPMTLTDIYNQTEINFQPEKRKAVGF